MRFAKPLVAGARYRSYVKMIPTPEDGTVYLGDVYILQDDVIIGLVGGIQFRRYPRILLNRFFSAPDADGAAVAVAPSAPRIPKEHAVAIPAAPKPVVEPVKVSAEPVAPPPAPAAPAVVEGPTAPEASANTTSAKALQLIADEAALNVADLVDDASFANFGVDSLMSLVIAEKFREQLGIVVSGSLFLEYPTIKDLRTWLEEYAD